MMKRVTGSMRIKNLSNMKRLLLVTLVGILMFACEEYPEIDLLTYDDQVIGTDPVILDITPPAATAFAAYTIITISGEHFSPDSGGNTVYFSGVQAQIQSESETEIVVLAPDIVGEDLALNLVVDGALNIVTVPYSLANLSLEYGGFGNAEKTRCIAVDNAENLYAMLDDRTVIKVTETGERTIFGTTLSFPSAGEMRVGPGGALFIQRTSQRSIYRIGPDGGDAEEHIIFPESVEGSNVRLTSFDFDAQGNIYAGGVSGGLVAHNVNGNVYGLGDYYDGVKIKSVRVYDGYVYLGREDGIWRSEILSDTGSVGAGEFIFDWENSGTFSASDLKSITFASDGDMYIGTANTTTTTLDPILVLHPDGSTEALYPGQLLLPADHMVWGSGAFMYVNRANRDAELRRIIRVNLLKPGAPHYGRGL
ncbi:MAG: IPT/TIG domain-containing protein [Candidatus Marinimicrobia bacterium]|nr:IPT/TIG domain-containing protein [FCB group bacterium]MBL7024937.1 IPT/TIG domain-containing protein [Candidatus Neomarinimicrobiota bacterium]